MLLHQYSNNINMESLAFLKMVTEEGGMASKGKSEEMGYCGRLDVIAEKERRAKAGNGDFIRRASVYWFKLWRAALSNTVPDTGSERSRTLREYCDGAKILLKLKVKYSSQNFTLHFWVIMSGWR